MRYTCERKLDTANPITPVPHQHPEHVDTGERRVHDKDAPLQPMVGEVGLHKVPNDSLIGHNVWILRDKLSIVLVALAPMVHENVVHNAAPSTHTNKTGLVPCPNRSNLHNVVHVRVSKRCCVIRTQCEGKPR